MTDLEKALLDLLNRIEIEESSLLALQRFDIVASFGYLVHISDTVLDEG